MARSGRGSPEGAQTQDNFGSLSHACLSGEIAPAGGESHSVVAFLMVGAS